MGYRNEKQNTILEFEGKRSMDPFVFNIFNDLKINKKKHFIHYKINPEFSDSFENVNLEFQG